MQSSDGLLCALACGCGEEAELKENKSHHWLHLDVVTMSWSWLSVARASGQRSNARGRLRLDDSRAPAESSHTMRSPILPSPPSPPPHTRMALQARCSRQVADHPPLSHPTGLQLVSRDPGSTAEKQDAASNDRPAAAAAGTPAASNASVDHPLDAAPVPSPS